MLKSKQQLQPAIITQRRAPAVSTDTGPSICVHPLCIKRQTDGRTFFVKSIFGSTAPTIQSSTHSHTSSRLGQEDEKKKKDFQVIITSNLDVG